MCSRSFSWQVTAEGSMPVPDVVGISIGSITRALSARAAHGAVVTNPAAGSGLSLRLHAERLPPARYLQGAREVAPEYDGEVSEERGARSGDIKDDGLHGSPSLGHAHYPRRPRGAPRGRGSARHGFGSAARTHLGGGRLCPFDRELVSRHGGAQADPNDPAVVRSQLVGLSEWPGGMPMHITRSEVGLAIAATAVALVCMPAWGAADEKEAAETRGQSAVWTARELSFVYVGFTAQYSCEGLRDRVTDVLLQLGARRDLE